VSQLTSLYNVVLQIHSYCILEEVLLVTHILLFDFKVICQRGDGDYAPLLYVPFVLFAGHDGCWYRVLYGELCRSRMPAGWAFALQEPITGKTSELLLFANGAIEVGEGRVLVAKLKMGLLCVCVFVCVFLCVR
jgi:hypothetical protein